MADSSDDDAILLDYLDDVYPTMHRKVLEREDPFNDYDEEQFRMRYRLKKENVLLLLSEIEQRLEYPTDRNNCVSPINQLLITLRFYATGTFQLVLGDGFGIDKSTACRVIHKVTRAIAALRPKYVKFPRTPEERRRIMLEVYNVSNLPGVVGAIDCTHIPIQSVGTDEAEIFRNRKGYFSINVQLICDSSLYVSDVVARWPGSVHDSTIFDFSHVRALFENGTIQDGYLVGDSGYPCRKYLMTPLKNPITHAEKAYNSAHISARNCIERANGVLKRRFPALQYGMRLKLKNILPVIVAVVVCHNIATIMGEDIPPEDVSLQEFIQRQRMRGIQVQFDQVDALPPPQLAPQAGAFAMRQAIINRF